jgi:type IV secretion system protein VirD4
MIGLALAGIHQEYGKIPHDYNMIIADFKAQTLKNPDTLRVFTPYFGAAVAFPMLLLAMAFRFRPKGEYGSSHWARPGEIKKMGLWSKKGVILAKKDGELLRYDKTTSALIIAPPGAGKTAACIIPNALYWPESMVVVDIKGEIFAKTAHVRKKFSRVLEFIPAGRSPVKFNPFAKEIVPEDDSGKIRHVQQISSLIYSVKGKGDSGDHWVQEARNMFNFFALYLLYFKGETSLPEIRSFALTHPSLYEWIGDLVTPPEEEGDEDPADPFAGMPAIVKEEATALSQKAYKEFSGILSSFKIKLDVFSDPVVAENFSGNDFTFEEFRSGDKPVSLYIKVAEDDMERIAPALRIYLDLFYKRMMSAEPAKTDYAVLGIFDEFPRMGYLPVLQKMPALGRSYKLPSLYAFQDAAQVEEVYGREGMRILNSSTEYKLIFFQNDYETAKKIADSVGQYTRIKKGDSESTRDGELKTSKSKSKNLEGASLIRADELMSLKEDEVIVVAGRWMNTPIKATPAYWFQDRAMKKLVG